jgi:hypothetical protein
VAPEEKTFFFKRSEVSPDNKIEPRNTKKKYKKRNSSATYQSLGSIDKRASSKPIFFYRGGDVETNKLIVAPEEKTFFFKRSEVSPDNKIEPRKKINSFSFIRSKELESPRSSSTRFKFKRPIVTSALSEKKFKFTR